MFSSYTLPVKHIVTFKHRLWIAFELYAVEKMEDRLNDKVMYKILELVPRI